LINKELNKDDINELDLSKDLSDTKNDLNKGLKSIELSENESHQTESKEENIQAESLDELPVVTDEESSKRNLVIDQN
jgi:hypothetical protein